MRLRSCSGSSGFATGPGLGAGITFSAFDRGTSYANGKFLLRGTLAGTGIVTTGRRNDTGLWRGTSAGNTLAVRAGDDAANITGVYFGAFNGTAPNVDSQGRIGFLNNLAGAVDTSNNPLTDNDESTWVTSADSSAITPTLVARATESAPGTSGLPSPPYIYRGGGSPNMGSSYLSNDGRIYFRALVCTTTGTDNRGAVFVGTSSNGSVSLATASGAFVPAVPGRIAAGTFLNPSTFNPVIGPNGSFAVVSSTGGGTTVSRAFYVLRPGENPLLVLKNGDDAPGLPGVTLSTIAAQPYFAANGRFASLGFLSGTGVTSGVNDEIIYNGLPESPTALARKGQASSFAGTTYGSLTPYGISSTGAVVFGTQLLGTGVTTANDFALFIGSDTSVLPLLREGDVVEALPGQFRTVSSFLLNNTFGGNDGRPISVNALGQVGLVVNFTDGTNAVVVVAVPEPASLTGLLVAGPVLTLKRRR